MGLDSHFYRVGRAAVPEDKLPFFDSDIIDREIYKIGEIAYFRKNYKLHEMMYEVYKKKGGTAPSSDFNLICVAINDEDLEYLVDGWNEYRRHEYALDDDTEYFMDEMHRVRRNMKFDKFLIYYEGWF